MTNPRIKSTDGEDRRKHLEMIQGVINRLAGNSFAVKGWAVTLVAALFALAAQGTNPKFVYIAFVPVLAFWLLDAYFLRQERLFRALYDAATRSASTDYSMDTRNLLKEDLDQVAGSITLTFFYVPLLLAVILVAVITYTKAT